MVTREEGGGGEACYDATEAEHDDGTVVGFWLGERREGGGGGCRGFEL